MTTLKRIGVTLASLAVLLLGGDLAGVAMCFFGDLFSSRSWSTGAIYATWFSLGILVGFIHYAAIQEYCKPEGKPDSKKLEYSTSGGVLGIAVTIAALYGLAELFNRTRWRRGVTSNDGYVPDNMAATMTYFGCVIAGMCLFFWIGVSSNAEKRR